MTEAQAYAAFRATDVAAKIWQLVEPTPANLAIVETAFAAGYWEGVLSGIGQLSEVVAEVYG